MNWKQGNVFTSVYFWLDIYWERTWAVWLNDYANSALPVRSAFPKALSLPQLGSPDNRSAEH